MDYGKELQKAREALEEVWQEMRDSGFVGRLFGRKNKGDNQFHGSHITISNGTELVSIFQMPDGKLVVLEFSKVEKTSLGTKVRRILEEKEGLPINKKVNNI